METKRMTAPVPIGIFLALAVFVLQLFSLPHVGMSWDEPSSFFVGRANLKFWMTGNRAYLDDLKNKTLFAGNPIQYIYGEDIYPPFPYVISSFTSYVFAERFPVMTVTDAHHLGEIIIASLGVWAMYGLASFAGLTPLTATVTTLMYALYPTIVDSMRSDTKDVPLVSMVTLAMYFFLRWFVAHTKGIKSAGGWAVLFAISLGLAGSSKPTAAIIVPIIMVWMVLGSVGSVAFRKQLGDPTKLLVICGTVGLLSVAVFVFVWPWLWDNPVEKIGEVWSFFKTVGYNMPTMFFGTAYKAGVDLPKRYPFVILLIQTPLEITLFAAIGILSAIWMWIKKKTMLPVLFIVWFTIGMGRFFLPGVLIYAKVRHFIDVMPAFFILAGFGIEKIAAIAPQVLKPKALGIIGIVVIAHEVFIMTRFFPYETSYFNVLVGGARTVAQKRLFDIGPSTAVKEAMGFIAHDSGGKDVYVYPCLMGHLAVQYATDHVRITGYPEQAAYTFAPNSISWFIGTLAFSDQNHQKVYTVTRDGADLFYVYRYKAPFGWRCGWESNTMYDYMDDTIRPPS